MYRGKHYKKERLSDRILMIPFFEKINGYIDQHDDWWDNFEEKLSNKMSELWDWFINN